MAPARKIVTGYGAPINEVRNPSVELGLTTDGTTWGAHIPTSLGRAMPNQPVRITTDAAPGGGVASVSYRVIVGPAGQALLYSPQNVPVTPGERLAVRISGEWLADVAPTRVSVRVRFTKADNAYLSEPEAGVLAAVPARGEWRELTGSLTVPANAAFAAVMVICEGIAGSYNGVRNPSVEVNTNDLNGFGPSGGSVAVARITTDAAPGGGTACAQWTITTPTGGPHSGSLFHQSVAADPVALAVSALPTSSGRIVFARGRVKAPAALTAGAQFRWRIRFMDSAGAFVATTEVSGTGAFAVVNDPVPGEWYDFFGTVVAPAGAAWASIRLDVPGLGPSSSFSVRTDKWMICHVPTANTFPAYVDGDQPGMTWQGTPHASVSGTLFELRADKAQIVKTAVGNPEYRDGSMFGFIWEGEPHASRTLSASQFDDLFDRYPEIPEWLDRLPSFVRDDPDVLAVVYAMVRERRLIRAAHERVRANAFPATADALSLRHWEDLVGIDVEPEGATEDERRTTLNAFAQGVSGEGGGAGWEEAITRFVGAGWTYEEHRTEGGVVPAYSVAVSLPFPPTSREYRIAEDLIRSVTPAHVALTVAFAGGFTLDGEELDQGQLG